MLIGTIIRKTTLLYINLKNRIKREIILVYCGGKTRVITRLSKKHRECYLCSRFAVVNGLDSESALNKANVRHRKYTTSLS